MTSVLLRTVTGVVHEINLGTPVQVDELYQQASKALDLPTDGFKLIHKGATIPFFSTAAAQAASSQASGQGVLTQRRQKHIVHLSAGDVVLVVPQRRGPSERLQRAAAEATGAEIQDSEDAALRFSLKPGTPAWEVWLANFLQERCHAPELLLTWLFHIGPSRLLAFAAVMAGARMVYQWDPGFSAVYLLVAMLVAIFTGLGTKKEGEASAYSVFNPGVQRLPGQLDADEIDRQIRRGQI